MDKVDILSNVFTFLSRDNLEKIQPSCRFINDFIIRHKNTLPIRKFQILWFFSGEIRIHNQRINFPPLYRLRTVNNGKDLGMIEFMMEETYRHLKPEEVLKNLRDVFFETVYIDINGLHNSHEFLVTLKNLKMIVGAPFKTQQAWCHDFVLDRDWIEIFDQYILTDKLFMDKAEHLIRRIFEDPEADLLPKSPKELSLGFLYINDQDAMQFSENHFRRLEGKNRITIKIFLEPESNGSFCQLWYEKYAKHREPSFLTGKFEFDLKRYGTEPRMRLVQSTKKFLKDLGSKVEYSTEQECHLFQRHCVVHKTMLCHLVIVFEYEAAGTCEADPSELNVLPFECMKKLIFWLKPL